MKAEPRQKRIARLKVKLLWSEVEKARTRVDQAQQELAGAHIALGEALAEVRVVDALSRKGSSRS